MHVNRTLSDLLTPVELRLSHVSDITIKDPPNIESARVHLVPNYHLVRDPLAAVAPGHFVWGC